jgi:hypothetical protein
MKIASPMASEVSTSVAAESAVPVLPSGYVKITIENGPFIVDVPMKNGDFP